MSNEINAIAQNNYILHNIDAKKLYVQEPLFTANSGDAVYVGWRPDETVLFENTSGLVLSNNPSITLTENYQNFEYIRFYAKGFVTTQAILAGELDAQNPYTDTSQNSWMTVPCGGATGAALRFNQFALSASGNICKFYNTRQFSLQGTAVSTATCAARLTKVVGINRISGGNS